MIILVLTIVSINTFNGAGGALNAFKSGYEHGLHSSTKSQDNDDDTDDLDNNESSSNTAKLKYHPVDLLEFANHASKYVNKGVKTSGTVALIEKKPSDKNMYYVVIAPDEGNIEDGFTVAEINTDIMDEEKFEMGDNITVKGGGMMNTVKLNGKTIKSSIIADSATNG